MPSQRVCEPPGEGIRGVTERITRRRAGLARFAPAAPNDLVVRSRPGAGSDSEIYPARLSAPATVYVIAGPEASDGYDWYLVEPVAPSCYFGCDHMPRAGWVAAASKEGERWLAEEPERDSCSDDPTLNELLTIPPQMALYCYTGQDLILVGTIAAGSTNPTNAWPWEWRNRDCRRHGALRLAVLDCGDNRP